ncbi:pectinesterase family protein [Paenibacillus turpanensis]|uniref:pectinesterase family protein n=1 Tax=Paenibacillus turpanensis TaxID=2689078 RepID=UPI00140C2D16|nr:pectinesterase family protein [Paenibacillus turpanensis]
MMKALRIALCLLLLASYAPLLGTPVVQASSGLPEGWHNIEYNGSGGSTVFDSDTGVFTLQTSGAGITNQSATAEQFQYAYTPINGNFTLIARLDSFPYASGAQAGILLRSTLNEGSSFLYGYLYGTGNKYQPYVTTKSVTGGSAGNSGYSTSYEAGTVPEYMRMRKQWNSAGKADVYYDLGTSDGTNITWTKINGKSIQDPGIVTADTTMYVGLAVGKAATATFDQVTLVNAYTSSMTTPVSELTTTPSYFRPSVPAISTPAGVEAFPGNAKVDVSWNTVTGATYYNVKRSLNAGGAYTAIAEKLAVDPSVKTVTYTDTEVTNGTSYYYVVTASDYSGESAPSVEVSAKPAAAILPSVPTDVKAYAEDGKMKIVWSSANEADSYHVKRKASGSDAYTVVASHVTSTSYVDTDVTNGTTYTYVVSAVNTVGESADSSAVSGMPKAYILYDDFESRELGVIPPGYSSLLEQSEINNITVINTRDEASRTNSWYVPNEAPPAVNISPEIAGNTTNVLWVNDNANSGRRGSMVYKFAPVSGAKGITAQLDFMQPKVIGDSYVLELVDSSGKLALSYNVNSSPVKIDGNKWYTIKYVADVGANTAGLYVNGEYQGNVKFSNPVTDIAGIQARTAGSSLGMMYIDNVYVYEQHVTTPQDLTGEGADRRVELTWDAASGVDSYKVYRSETAGGPYTQVAAGVATNSYLDTTGLENNKWYYYTVTAVGANGESEASNEAAALPNDVPPPSAEIQNFKAVIRDSQLTLTWDAVEGASFYTLQRGTTANGPFLPLLQGESEKLTETSYLDTKLTNGVEYYYVLTAGNVGGLGSSKLLEKVSPAPALAAPVLVTAEPANHEVELQWTAVSKAEKYTIHRGVVNGGPYEVIGETAETGYTDATAVNGKAYYYVVTAVDGTQTSMISNQLKAKPYQPAAGAPSRPVGLKGTAHEGSVGLAWEAAEGAESYHVKRAVEIDGQYTSIGSTAETTFTDTSVTNGTTYYYTVSAVNSSGESADSSEVAALPAKVLTVDANAAADGVKVFNTVQSAVNAVPANNTERIVIYIAPGTYQEKLTIDRPYVSLVGAGMDQTLLTYGDYAGTSATQGKPGHTGNTFLSQSVAVTADHFTASNLTIENSSGPRKDVAQAVALLLRTDKAVFESVRLKGYQDTLYNGANSAGQGRHYFRDSIIEGDVDFIFGEAPAVVMENVKLVLVSHTGGGGHITAGAQRNITDKGYVFLNSQIVDDASAQGTYDLGRAWKDYARVSFINTLIDSNNFLESGWSTSCAGSCKESFFFEYNSYGPGANAAAREVSTQLTGAEASVTVPQLFDGWDPSVPVNLPMENTVPTVSVASSSFDKYEPNQADINVTLQLNGHSLTSITNGAAELGTSDYTLNGNVVTIHKSYLAQFEVGKVTLNFVFGGITVPVTITITNSDSSEIGKQVLGSKDGWGAYSTGTTGGSTAAAAQIFTVSSRSELIEALGGDNTKNASNSTPKIIYVNGTIDMNVDENDQPVGTEYFQADGYDFDQYLAAYDPSVWGMDEVPSGPLENARAASSKKQGDHIKINIGSNTTLVGLPNSNAKIIGGNLMVQNVDNVIIRNIEFVSPRDFFPQWDPTDGDYGNWNSAFDTISIRGATHVWIDHNTFSDGNYPDNKSHKYFGRHYQQHDGLLDITNASDLITVSYNYFHDHDKTTLVGGSDSYAADEGKERITFHHNYYRNVTQRVPRVRYGKVHLYNNLYEGTYNHASYPFSYAMGVGYKSEIYAENNYFALDSGTQASALVQVSDGTMLTDHGNLLNGAPVDISAAVKLTDVTWTPSLYPAMDSAANVPNIVRANAGSDGARPAFDEDDDDNDGGSSSGGTSGGAAGGATGGAAGGTTNDGSGRAQADLSGAAEEKVDNGTITVTIDASKAASLITQASATTEVFLVPVKGTAQAVKVVVEAKVVKQLADKNADAVLRIETANGTYSLPAEVLGLQDYAQQMGVSEEELTVTVTLQKLQGEQAEQAEASAAKLGAKLAADLMDYTVTVQSPDGQTEDIGSFTAYAARTIPLNGEIDPNTAAGVMYHAETQTYTPVPTVFKGNEATFLRRGNSIYTVIEHEQAKSFDDLSSHWAKNEVETLASKLIVNGVSAEQFAPEKQVTRAEFAALLVRALGLTEQDAIGFSDIEAGQWYYGAVGAAKNAGLISGFEDGTFRPNEQITREQMTVMIVRALQLGGQEVEARHQLLEKFSDASSISTWSKEAVAQLLSAGIIQGTSATEFAAHEPATRAQAAVMLMRTLKALNFINE